MAKLVGSCRIYCQQSWNIRLFNLERYSGCQSLPAKRIKSPFYWANCPTYKIRLFGSVWDRYEPDALSETYLEFDHSPGAHSIQ